MKKNINLKGIIVVLIYCKIKNIKLLNCLDYIVPFVAIAQSIGRWGNFFNREVFGEYTDSFFAMRLPVDAVRVSDISVKQRAMMEAQGAGINYIQVHPTFLYEGLWNLGLLIFMLLFRKHKKYDGQLCLLYLGGYGIGRFIIEGIRTDQLLIPNTSIPVSQALGMILFVFSVIMNFIISGKNKKKTIQE